MAAEQKHHENPIGTQLVFEDERVRIWRIELEPGEEAAWHTHELDYTTITIEGDLTERLNDDGTVDRIAAEPGKISRWYQSTRRHALRNVGTQRFRNVIIENKGTPADFAARQAARSG
jgi:quercetin dioxygenase-like cupin family protein